MSSLTKLIIIILAGAVASLVLVFVLIKPNLNKAEVLGQMAQDKLSEFLTLQQQVNAYKAASSDLSKAVAKDKIANMIVLREDLVAAIKNVEAAASKSAVASEIKINEPDEKSKVPPKAVLQSKGELTEIPYRFYTTSDFNGVVKFIQYLEHLPQWMEIAKMDLSAETITVDKNLVQTGKIFGTIDGIFLVKTSP
ncbi:MAG: hypothetical protein HY545_02040 [Candidatus Doudnabacteria bacterium]|nr:hypothetical protein [Candidatus Doudnabacteria bacterium]